MFLKKTVFVVGAGASYEIGLPLGSGLKENIIQSFKLRQGASQNTLAFNSVELNRALRELANVLGKTHNEVVAKIDDLKKGLRTSNSIDDFLDTHRNDELIVRLGKLAIVNCISGSERSCLTNLVGHQKIYTDSQLKNLEKTWFQWLISNLSQGATLEEVEKSAANLSFIIFNYDRCIEHFIFHALSVRYPQATAEQISSIVEKINFIHPYGSLGDLNSISPSLGDPNNAIGYLSSSENIRLYTEGVFQDNIVEEISSVLKSCRTLIFLGYGFHVQNNSLLNCIVDSMGVIPYIGGTVYKIAPANIEAIKNELSDKLYSLSRDKHFLMSDHIEFQKVVRKNITFANQSCVEFLSSNERAFL